MTTVLPAVALPPVAWPPASGSAPGSAPVIEDGVGLLGSLFDPGSLRRHRDGATGGTAGAGAMVATGTVAGARTVGYAVDRLDGSACAGIVAATELATRWACPVVGLWRAGQVELADGVGSLDAIGSVFHALAAASGRVPQISVVLGSAAGAAAHAPALADLVVMAESGRMYVTGPEQIRRVTGEEVDPVRLGGSKVHASRTGVAHLAAKDPLAALEQARRLVELMASPERGDPGESSPPVDLAALLPAQASRAYNVRPLVNGLLDVQSTVELQAGWAPNIVTALGRLAGRTVGVIANNPLRLGGCLDSASAEKAARFVRMCDSFGVPLVVLVDVPGYLPGVGQEWDGVVRRGAKLLHAFAEAVVPRVTLVTRKAYGGAYIAMNSRSLGATAVYAWPGAEVAVMSASAAVNITARRQLAAAPPEERDALREALIEEQIRSAGGLARAVEHGLIDEVIEPAQTRQRLARAIFGGVPRAGRHTNIPL